MKDLLVQDKIPRHIAVIMDGNGRWAKRRGAMRVFGHRSAIKSVREISEGCAELGVDYLTLYAFSTENWARPKEEVDGLMALLVSTIRSETETLMKNEIRLSYIGDIEKLPTICQKELQEAVEITKSNSRLNLILALNYSGRWDILGAVQRMLKDVKGGAVIPEQIDAELFSDYLSTKGIPDPELMIRTSGEMRISNFLLWQLAYSELYITDTLWPDFRKEDLHKAIYAYQHRDRRFGKVTEKVSSK